jgi:hypothetical protein
MEKFRQLRVRANWRHHTEGLFANPDQSRRTCNRRQLTSHARGLVRWAGGETCCATTGITGSYFSLLLQLTSCDGHLGPFRLDNVVR